MPRVQLPAETERLVLRTVRPGDEPDLLAYRSQPDVVRYIPGDPMRESEVEAFVADRAGADLFDEENRRIFLVVDLGGRVIGDVIIHNAGPDGPDGQQAEIGWVFHPEFGGQGYATETARELLRMAFDELGVHRVWARLEPENTASGRLCERLGMRREAVHVAASWFKGTWTDLAVYALLEREWRDRS